MERDKTILIVDDSDVDRMVLKTILSEAFEAIDASGGYPAMDILKSRKIDAVMLDISMPGLDGFGMLQHLEKTNMADIPIFLISSEATKDNAEKAKQHGVASFIKKPFNRENILKRVKLQLGVVTERELTNDDIRETYKYISELEAVYNRYLINFGRDDKHYMRITDLMKMMLTEYAASSGNQKLDKERIEIISKAGYFCDIGEMIVPPETVNIPEQRKEAADEHRNHTFLGAKLINLNHSEHCRYFMDVCEDICMHHHERYDGNGFPHKVVGDGNLIYTQMCRLADRFDSLFIGYQDHDELQFEAVLKVLEEDEGNVSKEVMSVLADCKSYIIKYYHAVGE